MSVCQVMVGMLVNQQNGPGLLVGSRTHGRGTFVCSRRLGPAGQSTQSHRSHVSAYGSPAIPKNFLRSFMGDFLNLLRWTIPIKGHTIKNGA